MTLTKQDKIDVVKHWLERIQREEYRLIREVKAITRHEIFNKWSVRVAIQIDDVQKARESARNIVIGRKKVVQVQAHLKTFEKLKESLITLMKHVFEMDFLPESEELRSAMSSLASVPEVGKAIRNLSEEMQRRGVLPENYANYLENPWDDVVYRQEEDDVIKEMTTNVAARPEESVLPPRATPLSDVEMQSMLEKLHTILYEND